MNNLRKNFFTFEGVEGAGKSTVIKLLFEKLKNDGHDVFITREPGGLDLKFAEEIRKIIFKYKDIDSYTELFLFSAARREHINKVIIPNLEKGKIVICDRFIDSTLAYQTEQVKFKEATIINKIAINKLLPSKTFLLDIDPKISLKRIQESKKREVNKFDNQELDYHWIIREKYLNLAKKNKDRFIKIDANNSIQNVVEEVYNKLKDLIK